MHVVASGQRIFWRSFSTSIPSFHFSPRVGQFSAWIGVLIKATERRKPALFGCREMVLERTFNVLVSRDSGVCACAWNGFLFVSSFTDTVLLDCRNRITSHAGRCLGSCHYCYSQAVKNAEIKFETLIYSDIISLVSLLISITNYIII